ncbi:flagellar type III secretion system pore protein FliP [Burkholderia sp. BE17]|uniref:flagellar type III secretion system pore protein FliP n=1 Tax=Burkholderia sp. BE17 TaxID=2656644 RepID=UPI00128E2E97|nr:flagellar type III secretion system pore protein FliP [Burkholderia sp. BE17]MPV70228.1 flagellar type III secretion system pore protein FliP [Burkholderia sp. BE17]
MKSRALLRHLGLALAAVAVPALVQADTLTLASEGAGGQGFTVKTQILVLMTLLGLLPALLMTMTSFLRYVIVLSLLKQALGLQQGLPGRIVTGVALVLTMLTMRPVGEEIWQKAFMPYDQGKIGMQVALTTAEQPLGRYMLAQTNKATLAQMARLSGTEQITEPEKQPFLVKLSAFVLSELKTAFQVGAMLFIPFLIVDIIVASVLMAMGMMMLSPLVISLPLKLLLFVLVDGWSLTVNTLITSIKAY